MNDNENNLLATVARMLGHFKLHNTARPTNYSAQPVGNGSSYLLQVAGTFYLLSANGGEFMLDNVNSDDYASAIPLTYDGIPLNAATIATRIATDLCGEPIDYEQREDEEMNTILKSLV